MKRVTIFTDGGCLGNPGPGGFGVVLLYGKHRKELSSGYRWTTSNRMELMAAIVGLEALKFECRVTLYSDSEYVVKSMREGKAQQWRTNDWRLKSRKGVRAKNRDLWERLLNVAEKHHIEYIWVRGHSNVQDNERCDELAKAAARLENLQVDAAYERENRPGPLRSG